MSAEIDYLPIWKKDATAAERLFELGEIARKYPERFEKFVLGYSESLPNGNRKIRTFQHNCSLLEQFGLIDLLKDEMHKESVR